MKSINILETSAGKCRKAVLGFIGKIFSWTGLAVSLFIVGIVNAGLTGWFLYCDGRLNNSGLIDGNLAANIGTYLAGTSGTLWGAAGLIILIQTLITQKESIQQQREYSTQQAFETTFFNLLEQFVSSSAKIENILKKNASMLLTNLQVQYAFQAPLDFAYRWAVYGVKDYPSAFDVSEQVCDEFCQEFEKYLKEMKDNGVQCIFYGIDPFNKLKLLLDEICYYGKDKDRYFRIILNSIPHNTGRTILMGALVANNDILKLIKSDFNIPCNTLYSTTHTPFFKD